MSPMKQHLQVYIFTFTMFFANYRTNIIKLFIPTRPPPTVLHHLSLSSDWIWHLERFKTHMYDERKTNSFVPCPDCIHFHLLHKEKRIQNLKFAFRSKISHVEVNKAHPVLLPTQLAFFRKHVLILHISYSEIHLYIIFHYLLA